MRLLTNEQRELCPNRAAHVKNDPYDYASWFEWAEWKALTHVQSRCPRCRLFVIWKRKPREAT